MQAAMFLRRDWRQVRGVDAVVRASFAVVEMMAFGDRANEQLVYDRVSQSLPSLFVNEADGPIASRSDLRYPEPAVVRDLDLESDSIGKADDRDARPRKSLAPFA
jgi:hypothetical protein